MSIEGRWVPNALRIANSQFPEHSVENRWRVASRMVNHRQKPGRGLLTYLVNHPEVPHQA